MNYGQEEIDFNPATVGGVEWNSRPEPIERNYPMTFQQQAPSAQAAFQAGLGAQASSTYPAPAGYVQPMPMYQQPMYQQPHQQPMHQPGPWDSYGMSQAEYYQAVNEGRIQTHQQPAHAAPAQAQAAPAAQQPTAPAPNYEIFVLKDRLLVYIECPGSSVDDIEISYDYPNLMVEINRANIPYDLKQVEADVQQAKSGFVYATKKLPLNVTKPIEDDIPVTLQDGLLKLELIFRSKGEAKKLTVKAG